MQHPLHTVLVSIFDNPNNPWEMVSSYMITQGVFGSYDYEKIIRNNSSMTKLLIIFLITIQRFNVQFHFLSKIWTVQYCDKVKKQKGLLTDYFSLRCDIVEMGLLMCWECIENLCKFNRICLTFLRINFRLLQYRTSARFLNPRIYQWGCCRNCKCLSDLANDNKYDFLLNYRQISSMIFIGYRSLIDSSLSHIIWVRNA